jgi:hypothetical protein
VRKASRSHPSLSLWNLSGLILLLLYLASCASSPVDRPWVYDDLRALDSQVAANPATDILAVYTRTTDLSVDTRVDLLDINAGDTYTLELALWDNRDFSQGPLKIEISSTGMVQTSGIREGKPVIWPRVVQNFGLDAVTVSLNRFSIGDRYRLDVSTYANDPAGLADDIHNVRSDAQPPLNRAPILIAFWDAFPAATPAQALRRWDGAHTGPLGDRHGLLHVLEGSRRYGVPVALVDIKKPSSLAALNFMGNVEVLKKLYARGLLTLPDTADGEPADEARNFSRGAAAGFGLPASQFVYATSLDPSTLPGYRACFLHLADDTHLVSSDGIRLIPLPSADSVEATEDGPSLDVRRSLINIATSPDPTDLLVLGGSLPHSTWGDSDMAYPTFEWIASHPWIQALAGPDLLTFPAQARKVPTTSTAVKPAWQDQLRSAPRNVVTRSAWQTYLMLTANTTDTTLQALQNIYLGQVGALLEAANWAENHTPRSDCSADPDGDGQLECILANQQYFAILEPVGARLMQFFSVDENGPHQLVGPSSQFTIGLSDPSEWHPENGEAADPSVIPGAFADAPGTWINYTPTVQPDGITFTSPDNTRVKTYRLTEDGIKVLYQVNEQVSTRIPLALDPWVFYSGPSKYWSVLTPHSWSWSLASGSSIEVHTDAILSADGFISAIPFLSSSENPNLGYPKGHYLPFPLSVVTIQGDGTFSVEIIQK